MNKEITQMTMVQKAGVFTLVTVGILALSAVWFMYKSFSQQDTRTFTVQGKGEIDVQATKATINADFVGEGTTAEEATTKLSAMSTKAFAELDKAGVKKEDIKTASVSTNPKYEYCYSYQSVGYPTWCKNNPNQNRISGYEAMQNFTVSIKDNKELVEKLLGLFPTLGARSTNGPMWEVDNDAAIQLAREEAVKDARAKAEGIAKSLGMSLGKVQYYNENNGGYPQPMMYGKGSAVSMSASPEMARDMSIPVSQGTDKVTVNVDITYELE